MYSIGQFSKLTKTTIAALRFYDKTGLLKPEYTDENSGYRYYSSSQLNDLQKIIDNMEKESVDMWSILSKPIYFLCINKSIIESKVFEKQWKEKKDKNLEKFCQKLYAELLKNGFSFKVYVRESDYIDKWISNKRPQIELPYEFFLLGSPFVKKGAFDLLSKLEMDRLNSCLQYMSNEERVE